MKRLFKILGIGLTVLLIGFCAFYLVESEQKPQSNPSPEADELAFKMTEALNKTAWDSTASISWTFRGNHHYNWNRIDNVVNLKWGNQEALFSPETLEGVVTRKGVQLEGTQAQKQIKAAWDNFNNDSFWLAAPYKIFDPGTSRSIVTLNDGRTGLMVTYSSGGSTPGDSYVWILDENYQPTSVKMWVSILPIGGIEFSWKTISNWNQEQ